MMAESAEEIEARLLLEAIYMRYDLRERALRTFATGLCSGGFLRLGPGDGIPSAQLGFEEFERSAHIYRRSRGA